MSKTALIEDTQTLKAGKEKKSDAIECTRAFEKEDGLYAADEFLDPPPDGGYGWVCCTSVALMNFATWGPNTCYGIFLSYFLSSDYFPGATPTDFAIIGSIVIGLTLLLLPWAAACMSLFGYKPTLTFAVVLEAVAFISSSFAQSIGALYVTYGVLLGISFGFIFGSNTIVIPSWFLKKRALANGFGQLGIGLGGLVFSFAVHAMIDHTGDHRWAMRMLAIVTFSINIISLCFVQVRKPLNGEEEKKGPVEILKKSFDKSVLKDVSLHYCASWSSFTTIGYVILLFSISNYALSMGMTAQQATVALAIFNGSQAIGRPFMGWFSESVGRCNATIILMVYDLILILPFWFNITKFNELVPFCILLGFGAGVGSVNVVPLVSDVVGIQRFAAGIGYVFFGNGAVSIFAEIAGLKLRNFSSRKPYLRCQIFVACMYFCGLISLFPYREWKMRRVLNARINNVDDNDELQGIYQKLLHPTWYNYFKRMFYSSKI
ncbi:LAME_0A00518g1_1 [Lachancea meyersii CBS 8951]|uniref:LAME_0A00518g1_1 n=1 Tax=Lachancea meyersii CBS 8951 TaxID=1266667 RepID=A0A1G4ILA0_9SACH|nr:LAME_0A00518g1_1 [Lachancea meyersii CBS 8951]